MVKKVFVLFAMEFELEFAFADSAPEEEEDEDDADDFPLLPLLDGTDLIVSTDVEAHVDLRWKGLRRLSAVLPLAEAFIIDDDDDDVEEDDIDLMILFAECWIWLWCLCFLDWLY